MKANAHHAVWPPQPTLRLRRIALGLSQRDLAERAGISREQLSHLETGATLDPRISTLSALASALGCASLDELLPLNSETPADTAGAPRNLGEGGRRYGKE